MVDKPVSWCFGRCSLARLRRRRPRYPHHLDGVAQQGTPEYFDDILCHVPTFRVNPDLLKALDEVPLEYSLIRERG